MSNLVITIVNREKKPVPDILVNCDFYLEYTNLTSGRRLVSNTLHTQNGVSDSDGLVLLGVSNIVETNEFTKYWELYLGEVAKGASGKFEIKSKSTSKPTDTYSSFSEIVSFSLDSISKNITKDGKTGFYILPDKISSSKSIELIDVGGFSIDLLEKNFRDAEISYVTAKRIFEENLKVVDTSNIFETLTPYEPSNWESVITRLLEFEEGTLDAALRFSKKTGLNEEFRRLDMIKTSILYLKNLYPDIKIGDGEGMPYSK